MFRGKITRGKRNTDSVQPPIGNPYRSYFAPPTLPGNDAPSGHVELRHVPIPGWPTAARSGSIPRMPAAPAHRSNDPLHGLTLEVIVTRLVERLGWEELGRNIPVRCFLFDPSISSSLKFLRKTPWARQKVEDLYLASLPPEP